MSSSLTNTLLEAINRIILDPKNAQLLALVKGVRNGIVYGTKIRFPHALVMTFLFRSGTFREKMQSVIDATRTHGTNLATFVFIFKTLSVMLAARPPPGAPGGSGAPPTTVTPVSKAGYHTFLAGAVAGYFVFGRDGNNPINQQIVLYIFGRTMLALLKLAGQETGLSQMDSEGKKWWGTFAAVSWGTVMWMFRKYPELLQGSLRSSMVYLYDDSDKWDSLKTLLWHNE